MRKSCKTKKTKAKLMKNTRKSRHNNYTRFRQVGPLSSKKISSNYPKKYDSLKLKASNTSEFIKNMNAIYLPRFVASISDRIIKFVKECGEHVDNREVNLIMMGDMNDPHPYEKKSLTSALRSRLLLSVSPPVNGTCCPNFDSSRNKSYKNKWWFGFGYDNPKKSLKTGGLPRNRLIQKNYKFYGDLIYYSNSFTPYDKNTRQQELLPHPGDITKDTSYYSDHVLQKINLRLKDNQYSNDVIIAGTANISFALGLGSFMGSELGWLNEIKRTDKAKKNVLLVRAKETVDKICGLLKTNKLHCIGLQELVEGQIANFSNYFKKNYMYLHKMNPQKSDSKIITENFGRIPKQSEYIMISNSVGRASVAIIYNVRKFGYPIKTVSSNCNLVIDARPDFDIRFKHMDDRPMLAVITSSGFILVSIHAPNKNTFINQIYEEKTKTHKLKNISELRTCDFV